MEIISAELQPAYVKELHTLFLKEWKRVDSLDGKGSQHPLPSPLLALENKELLGGLSFTWSYPEGFSEAKLWINAVFVKSPWRGRGIARSLIREAVNIATKTGESELFVYTEIPQLYNNLNWQLVFCQGETCVLKVVLSDHGKART